MEYFLHLKFRKLFIQKISELRKYIPYCTLYRAIIITFFYLIYIFINMKAMDYVSIYSGR